MHRGALGAIVGVALALLIPIYPHQAMLRSAMVGQAGDRIDYRWSLHTSWGLLDAWRYDRPGAEELALDAGAFASVVAASIGIAVVLGRRSKLRA
jgi:hypothetical protein